MAGLSRPLQLSFSFVTPWEVLRLPQVYPTTPDRQRRRAITPIWFRLFPFRSPLLGESRLISFPPLTEMFHFRGYRILFRIIGALPLLSFLIRESRDHRLFAPPPGLSQLTTPFIAFWCQGIHPRPFLP